MANKVLYEYEGEMLSIKTIAGRVQLSHTTIYKYLKKGYTLTEAIELGKTQSIKSFKNREKTNNRRAKTYPYNGNPNMTVDEISSLEGISKDNLYRRLQSGMTPEEAVAEIKKNIAPKYPYLGGYYSKWQLERLTGVTKWHLDKNLSDEETYTDEEIIQVIDSYKKQDVCMYKGMSLYQYCIRMKYNYNVVYYNMKTYGLTPDMAINQYLLSGQSARFNHKYALGDVLLYHFLIKLQIEDRYVMDRIRKGRTEEAAIIDAIFFNRESYKTRTVRNKLRAIYDEISNLSDIRMIKDKYSLDDDDIEFFNTKLYRAEEVLTQYKLFSVIALLQASCDTKELQLILDSMGITFEELDAIRDDLLDGFVEREEYTKNSQIKYIWRKEN